MNISPTMARWDRTNFEIENFNAHFLYELKGFGVEFIDLNSQLISNCGYLKSRYTIDGLHLNSKGYQCWIKILKDRMKL